MVIGNAKRHRLLEDPFRVRQRDIFEEAFLRPIDDDANVEIVEVLARQEFELAPRPKKRPNGPRKIAS
jgi:hypothetical protein